MSFWHGEKQKTKLGTKDVATVISLPIFCRWSTIEGKNTAEQFVAICGPVPCNWFDGLDPKMCI